jgi:hypothetical protein
MASGSEMRVGDAEREATAAELREHYASGRLTLDELNDRIDKAFAAKTRGDLDGLMRDLPSARPGAAWRPGQPGGPGWGPGTGPGGGPGSGWTGPGSGWAGPGSGWTGPGSGWAGMGSGPGARCGSGAGYARRTIGSIISTGVVICALVTFGVLGAFGGVGPGRPFGIALLVLAFGLLRRLIVRRRSVRGRAPRGRRRY